MSPLEARIALMTPAAILTHSVLGSSMTPFKTNKDGTVSEDVKAADLTEAAVFEIFMDFLRRFAELPENDKDYPAPKLGGSAAGASASGSAGASVSGGAGVSIPATIPVGNV